MDKDAIRREARRFLRALPSEERMEANVRIARRVWTLPEIASAETLLLFADLPEEVATDAIAAEALARGIRLVYPRVVPETRTLTLHVVSGLDELRTGQYGIREPDPELAPTVDHPDIDAALVPGLAWDRHGGRLGRGAGYYDRLFAGEAWRGFRCGIFFAFQEVERIPAEPWDVPLQAVVTDREVWRGG